jgi:hypothetical protein
MYNTDALQSLQFINVRVEDLVHKPDAGRLVRVLVWKLDVDLPYAASERCYQSRIMMSVAPQVIKQESLRSDALSVGP